MSYTLFPSLVMMAVHIKYREIVVCGDCGNSVLFTLC